MWFSVDLQAERRQLCPEFSGGLGGVAMVFRDHIQYQHLHFAQHAVCAPGGVSQDYFSVCLKVGCLPTRGIHLQPIFIIRVT